MSKISVEQNIYNHNFVKHAFEKHKFKKHFHKNYSIGLITKGTHKLKIENNDIITIKNEIKIINPYDVHIADGNISWEYLNFMPSKKTIKEIAQDMCDDTIDCEIKFKNNIDDNRAKQYFINLFHLLEKNLEYEESFIILVSYLLKNHVTNDLHIKEIPSNIQQSINYIHNYYLKKISLDVLAKQSKLSKYHFIKVFSQKMGLTPHQYIIGLRLEYAIKLFKRNIPLSQIALKCGFNDQSHFIRTFKIYYGFTPTNLM